MESADGVVRGNIPGANEDSHPPVSREREEEMLGQNILSVVHRRRWWRGAAAQGKEKDSSSVFPPSILRSFIFLRGLQTD